MPGNCFGCVYTSVLAAGTTEINDQMFEAPADILFH